MLALSLFAHTAARRQRHHAIHLETIRNLRQHPSLPSTAVNSASAEPKKLSKREESTGELQCDSLDCDCSETPDLPPRTDDMYVTADGVSCFSYSSTPPVPPRSEYAWQSLDETVGCNMNEPMVLKSFPHSSQCTSSKHFPGHSIGQDNSAHFSKTRIMDVDSTDHDSSDKSINTQKTKPTNHQTKPLPLPPNPIKHAHSSQVWRTTLPPLPPRDRGDKRLNKSSCNDWMDQVDPASGDPCRMKFNESYHTLYRLFRK